MHVQVSVVLAGVSLALAWFSSVPGTTRAAPAAAPPIAARPAGVPGSGPGPILDRAARTRVVESIARQPLRFEANAGQFAAPVRYVARGVGYGVALTPTGATLTLAGANGRAADVAMVLVDRDGRPAPAREVTGRDRLPGVVNHYLGDDPARWQVGVG